MCGIGAIFGKNIQDGEESLRRSLDAVRHRGHTHHEMSVFDDCALGANRLGIVSPADGRQPASNEDGSVLAVFNGEIYNHAALRRGLEGLGHAFRTSSDTEVLVHLYEAHGPRMAGMLDSEMFAFFIYDRRRGSFFAARDRYGVKPLYHALDSRGNRHFSSEIKQLSQFPGIRELMHFPPGHFMENGKLTRYHEIPAPARGDARTHGEVAAGIRRLLDDAVRKRVDTDLPVAVFLSGGVDSASVLATAMKFHDDVSAITAGMEGSPDMEASRRLCSELGIRHLTTPAPAESGLAGIIPELVRVTESFEPHVIRHAAANLAAARLANEKGFRIILTGDGSEELFAGYSSFERCPDAETLPRWLEYYVRRLPRTQFQRVDRISMSQTLEARLPLFDTAFADYALRIPGRLKIRESLGKKTGKWIWREAMRDRIPAYAAERGKAVFSEGAGYAMGEGSGGPLRELAETEVSDGELGSLRKHWPSWNIPDKETAYYFRLFAGFGYAKAAFSRDRPYPGRRILRPGILGRLMKLFKTHHL